MQPQTLRIEKMLYGGTGTAATGASVPFVLPNELVQRTPTGEFTVLEQSPERVAPRCVHFGSCGGCHYQHAAYPAQLDLKRSILSDTLSAAGVADVPAIETHSADPWHYRNRIRLRVGEAAGELRVGYNRQASFAADPRTEPSAPPAFLPVTMCPIAAANLWHAASALLELAGTEAAIKSWLAAAVELELFTNSDETALQLTLFTRTPPVTSFAAFCAVAQQAIPQLTGAGVAMLPRKPSPQGRRAEHPKPGPQWGAPGLIYTVKTMAHWVPRSAFFQANRHLVPKLRSLVTEQRSGALAWDLYAGVGLFSRALAEDFQQVIAVEAAEPAAGALKSALASAPNGKHHRAFAATTLEFLQAAVVQRERPDLIVMDPPRAGIGAEVCALLGRIRAPELVYVSCDPITFARDLRLLTDSGYRIARLHLVDMFAQTFHMESVAVLHYKRSASASDAARSE